MQIRKMYFVVMLVLAAGLAACSGEAASSQGEAPAESVSDESIAEQEEVPEPTEPPAPTDPPQATEAPPEPEEALPEGVIFRDDFDGGPGDGWEWVNEDPSRWMFTDDGWIEIVADDPSFFGGGELDMVNFLVRDMPAGDFEIEVHIQAAPSENFHQATIFIFENPSNYIALNTGFCDLCQQPGYGYYMETIIDNNPFGDAYFLPRAADDTDVYLRLVNQNDSLTGYYATQPGQWQRAGAFGNFFEFNRVGIGTTNSNQNGVSRDLVARFDYFEIREP